MNQTLQAALNFHDAGVSVVPARIDGSKAPDGSWKQYQLARPSRDQIVNWFANGHQGVGIICGAVSGNLEMLELEGRAVSAGLLDEARELAFNSGLGVIWDVIANGYVEVTPSGGIHFLYRIADEAVPGNTKIARRPGENDSVEVLVETRGEGGFVITAPSSGSTHPSGQPWQLLKGSPATIPMLSWEERQAIHQIFKALDQMPAKESIANALSPTSSTTGDRPGDDFNKRASWKEILEPQGWKVVFTANGVTYWRRPGKSQGISATTGKNEADNLYVFTTSTTFEAEKPYSKFAAYAHLEHNDNFSDASRALRAKGYGASNLATEWQSSNVIHLPNLASDNEGISQEDEIESSWKPVNLEQYFDGSYKQAETSILARTDNTFLLYTGKVHSFYGESESGKSWLAQIAVAEQLKKFKKVIYIDFESDGADIINRLQILKVSQAEILQNFTYIRPDSARKPDDPYWLALLKPNSASLVIIDGVTEALTMWGGETKDNDAITRWMRLFPRAIAERSGACVVQIDHVTKDRETRGRFAIGGQAKLATIDGAAFLIEPLEAIAPGRTGSLTVRVTKDRPGFIRRIAGLYRKSDRTQEAAVVTIDSTRPTMEYVIAPPMLEDQAKAMREEKLDLDIVSFIQANPGCAKSKAIRGIEGWDDRTLLTRIDSLIDDGILENRGSARNFILYVSRDGVEKFNLVGAVVLPMDERSFRS